MFSVEIMSSNYQLTMSRFLQGKRRRDGRSAHGRRRSIYPQGKAEYQDKGWRQVVHYTYDGICRKSMCCHLLTSSGGKSSRLGCYCIQHSRNRYRHCKTGRHPRGGTTRQRTQSRPSGFPCELYAALGHQPLRPSPAARYPAAFRPTSVWRLGDV